MEPQQQEALRALKEAKKNLASAEMVLAKAIQERKQTQQDLQASQDNQYLNTLFKTLCVAEQEQRAIVRVLHTVIQEKETVIRQNQTVARIEKELLLLQGGRKKSEEGDSVVF
jgi:hypothetical protein